MTGAAFTPEQEARLAAFERRDRRRFRLTGLVFAVATAVHGTLFPWLLSKWHPAALVYALALAGGVVWGVSDMRRQVRYYHEDRAWREHVMSWEVQRGT